MKIIHIISAPAAGGAEIYVRDLSLALVEAGHGVSVIFLSRAEEVGRDPSYEVGFLDVLEKGGVDIEFIGSAGRRNPLLGWRRLRSLIRQRAPDIVHSHLFFGVFFSALCGVPVVYTRHGIELRLPRLVYRLALDRIVDTYIGICGACTKVLRGATSRPVVRIDNGVNPARIVSREPRNPETSAVRLIAVGQLTIHKNYSFLLDALHELSDLEWSLHIAGEGPLRGLIEKNIEKLGLERRVELLGNVADVPQRLASADVFVMSSASEGLPIAMIEATLTGLPVLVTNVGGCPEVVHAVANGLVVEVGDLTGLTAALRRLIESDTQRDFFAENARQYSGGYRLQLSVQRHEALYRRIVADKVKGRNLGGQ